ncbi:T9SS type A sorting domain-containing protein, partial [Bacteroidota bacterium]
GDLIGRLTTRDPDTYDIHSYQLVQGSGDDDNSKFMILGDMIMAAHQFDFEYKNQYTIRVRSTDLGTNHIENVFTVDINDVVEPAVGIFQTGVKALRIYPNPFTHYTTIQFPNPTSRSFQMILTDLSGKVYRIVDDITTSEYVLQKGDLKKGLYFIELRGPKTYRGKIVIE